MYKRQEGVLKIYNIIRDRSDLEKIIQNISIHQQSDPKLSSIQRRLANQDDTITKFYCMHNNVLFIKPSLDEEIWKIIIPTDIEKEIIMDYHIPVSYTHLDVYKRQGWPFHWYVMWISTEWMSWFKKTVKLTKEIICWTIVYPVLDGSPDNQRIKKGKTEELFLKNSYTNILQTGWFSSEYKYWWQILLPPLPQK